MLTNCKCITEIFDREINMKKNREIIFSYKINVVYLQSEILREIKEIINNK